MTGASARAAAGATTVMLTAAARHVVVAPPRWRRVTRAERCRTFTRRQRWQYAEHSYAGMIRRASTAMRLRYAGDALVRVMLHGRRMLRYVMLTR